MFLALDRGSPSEPLLEEGDTIPINATAPAPVDNREFSKALGRALGRPSWAPVPGVVLRLMFGEMAEAMLLQGQRVLPTRGRELGFTFRFERVDTALSEIYRGG